MIEQHCIKVNDLATLVGCRVATIYRTINEMGFKTIYFSGNRYLNANDSSRLAVRILRNRLGQKWSRIQKSYIKEINNLKGRK